MTRKRSVLLLALSTFFLYLSFTTPQQVHAHRMVVHSVEDGLVQVRYDDGTPAPLAYVSTFDQEGELVFEGSVDEEGYFRYDKEVKIHRFVADDGLGHRAALVNETESRYILESIPLFIRALLGSAILIFIAALFFFRNQPDHKSRKKERSH